MSKLNGHTEDAVNGEMKTLQDILINQLNRLDNPECDLEKEIKRSQAIMSVGTVMVNGAKVKVESMKVVLQSQKQQELPPSGKKTKAIGNGK